MLSRRWQRELRKSDMLARIGGEEFCVVLPRTPAAHAQRIAEKLRGLTAALPVELDPDSERSREVAVTVSIGVGTTPEPVRITPTALMLLADEAVYAAKAGGRNRVETRQAE
jgi:diguanylate cyclase (GGDEF)-like protein